MKMSFQTRDRCSRVSLSALFAAVQIIPSISRTDSHTGSIPDLTCFIDEALLSLTITNPQGHCVVRLASVNI